MNLIDKLKGMLFSPEDAQLSGRELLVKAKALIAGLPFIAQAMVKASNHRIQLRATASGGRTNGTTVWIQHTVLPTSGISADEFVVNVALQLGLLHHEVGHVNQTDFTKRLPDGIAGRLANILEDVRQENQHIAQNRAGRKYLDALSVASIITGMNGPVSVDDGPLGVFTSYLLFRCRSEFRNEPWFDDLAQQAERVMEEVFPKGICLRLDMLLDDVPNLRSTEDSIKLAMKIAKFLKAEHEDAQRQAAAEAAAKADQQDPNDDSASSADQAGGESDASPSSASSGLSHGDTDEGDGADAEGDDESGDCGNGDPANDGQASTSDTANSVGGDADAGNAMAAKADALRDVLNNHDPNGNAKGDLDEQVRQLLQQRQQALQNDGATTTLVHEITPPTQPGAGIQTGEEVDLDAAMLASTAMRNRLVQVLQADSLVRNAVGTRGSKLSGKHLYRAAVGDPRIFNKVNVGTTVDTVVVLVADTSGSMGGQPIQLLNQALYASTLAMQACPSVDVGIVAFPYRQFVLDFGQPARRYRERFTLAAGGGTPLHEGVAQGLQLLLASRKPRKLMVVLTDGDPDCASSARALIDAAAHRGVEVYGLGILTMSVTSLFDNHLVVENLQELPSKLMALLKGQLLRAA